MAELTRIGIFYDGSFFARVSEYYRYRHERGTWISIAGLHDFVRDEVAKREQTDARYCKIVEAHYFRGRFPAEVAAERENALLRERRFEDVLIRAGVTPHFLIMRSGETRSGEASTPAAREKGIDVWLALEAYELALRQHLNVVVLVTGDGDFLQLVRKLSTNGTRIMVTAWDLQPSANVPGTRTAQVLLDAATYPVMMDAIINDRARRHDPLVNNLFVHPALSNATQGGSERISSRSGPDSDGLIRAANHDQAKQDVVAQSGAAGVPSLAYSETAGPSTGIIANLPHEKDYGFIEPDGGGDNLFFHGSWVEGCHIADLQVGDPVHYVLSENPRDGRPTATQVSRTHPAQSPATQEQQEDW